MTNCDSDDKIGTPTILVRSYLSSHHLWAARHFTGLASEIEDSHRGRSAFNIAHRAYVKSVVLSSVAFLEAAINEIFQDAYDGHDGYTKELEANTLKALRNLWQLSGEEQGRSSWSILEKYQAALLCAGLDLLSTGEQPYQDANLLIRLRNALVHFKPTTLGGGKDHKLADSLGDKFEPNRLFEGSGNPYFPDKCLGAGCAKWAVQASVAFADKFFGIINVYPNYQLVKWPEP